MSMSSRMRMLTTLDCQEPDRTPCSFMLFKGLLSKSRDYLDFIRRQLDLGLDAYVQLPPRQPVVINDHFNLHGLPVSYNPSVVIQERVEHLVGERYPILVKKYHTPAGVLVTEVRQTEDWRWGDHVPFLDDFLTGRSRKFLIERMDDLDKLAYLLVKPSSDEINHFQRESSEILEFARQHELLVAGGWGVGADMLAWIFGLQNMVYTIYDQPEFLQKMLEMIAEWNRNRMEVMLALGIDLYIKRAWYENCDFFSPIKYQQFISPILKAEVNLAHQKGVRFGYIITSSCMPLLDEFAACGVDVLIGVDPAQWDLEVAKKKLGGKVCLWGGVNGHLTVETGTMEVVREEVRRAMGTLSPGGGFILSPVDNVRELSAVAWQNIGVLIQEWKRWNNG